MPELGFNSQVLNDKKYKSVYLFSNINNLRHFTSLDAIVSRNYFQTDIYSESLSSILPSYLLMTSAFPANNVLAKFNLEINQVVLEFDLQDIPFEKCLTLRSDYTLSQLSHDNTELIQDSLLLIPAYIPMCLVKKIIFRSEEEMRDFKATKFRSMESDYSKFTYSSAPFNGEFEIDVNKLYDLVSETKIDTPKELLNTLRRRDRLRGLLLAASNGVELNISDTLSINIDSDYLRLCANLMKNYEYSLQDDYKEINWILSSWFERKGMLVEIDFTKLLKDPTPFPILNKWPLNTTNYISDDLSLETICDRYAYDLILSRLLDSDPLFFKPIEFLDNFMTEFGDKTPTIIPATYVSEFDHLFNRYKKASEFIKLVIGQKEKVIDVLKRYQNDFNTLKAFMIFATASSPDNFIDLHNKLGKFNLTSFERRMVWSLYGMLNGVSPLGETLKQRRDLLIITELVVQQNELNDSLPIFSYALEKLLANKTNRNIEKVTEDIEGAYSLTISSQIGMDITIKVNDPIEPIRNLVINQLSRFDVVDKIKREILLYINIPNKYVAYETEYEDRDFKVEITPKGFRIRHYKQILTSKKVWEKWDLFKKEIIEERKTFASQTKEDIEIWKRIARGEAMPEINPAEIKKKKSAKKKNSANK